MIEYICLHCHHHDDDHLAGAFYRPCIIQICDCEDYEEMEVVK